MRVLLDLIPECVSDVLHPLKLPQLCIRPNKNVLGGVLGNGGVEEGLLDDGTDYNLIMAMSTFGEHYSKVRNR